MAQNRKARRSVRGDVSLCRGVFPLPGGRFVRVEFPAKLSIQGKYDVATALARAAKKLIEEADAAAAVLALENGGTDAAMG